MREEHSKVESSEGDLVREKAALLERLDAVEAELHSATERAKVTEAENRRLTA